MGLKSAVRLGDSTLGKQALAMLCQSCGAQIKPRARPVSIRAIMATFSPSKACNISAATPSEAQ
eukprot:13699213-Heterocapsa_arctica.AAC.1